MKTRGLGSRTFIYTLALATLFGNSPFGSTPASAQFKKFKSNPRFKSGQVKGNSPSPSSKKSDDEQNTSTFGARTNAPAPMKKSKYVNLNPETAFGPEIITSFDFPDTDIMVITKHMQKLTGINLILDKDVKGKVSITAPTAITVGDAWKAYLSALNMAGYTIVKSGAFYKIINARDVRYVPTKIYTGAYTPNTEAHMMKILSLKNVDASEISRNFRPFMSRYGRIIDIKQTNTIIISDTGANIARLEKLIKFLDVPGHEESLQIISVKYTSAQEIAKLLDEILKGSSSSGSSSRTRRSGTAAASSSRFSGSKSSNSSNISKIIAEPRTNSIIAMANAEGERQLRQLIKKLDVESVSANTGRIHVHYLNYGDAEDLAKTLSTLVSGVASTSKKSSGSRSFVPRGTQGSSLFGGEVKVTADKQNNALVVTAAPTDWLTLKSVIAKLDIPRDQVYVEGLIMETTIRKINAFGVEYLGAYGAGNAQRSGFLNGGGLADLAATGNPSGLSGFFFGGGGGGTIEIPNPVSGGDPITVNSVNGLIKAIASNDDTNVLATPQLLVMDNVQGEFEVGETIPVKKSITNSNGTSSETTENQEAKLTLKIKPQINKVTRFIKLEINQSINDFTGVASTSGGGSATNTRSVLTEVMVRDRDTIAMGGLLRDKETISFSKVPLLGDIPVLGWLFKNKSRTVEKVNMLFFLTPRILSPYGEESSKNSLAVLKKRQQHLKGTIADGEELAHAAKTTELQAKLARQAEAPLYDNASLNQFQKSNAATQGIGGEMQELEVPDYKGIMDSINAKDEL